MPHPLDLVGAPGPRIAAGDAVAAIRRVLRGPTDDAWEPPAWLLPHQRAAAQRVVGVLRCFGTALLADAVGLGKTWVALAVATRYRHVTLVVPASLRAQWLAAARRTEVAVDLCTHEALSRRASVPRAGLLVVDEAHRFRNPATHRYDALARGVRAGDVLLVTATPVVNRTRDLSHLLRLVLADHALAAFGLQSLHTADATGPGTVLQAVLPLVVARTARAAGVARNVPTVRAGAVRCEATLPPASLAEAHAAVCALRIPPLGIEGRALVQRSLLLRLTSSPEAFLESLRNHRRYLESAVEHAHGGAIPRRAALRRLLPDGDDDQLRLLFEAPTNSPSVASRLGRELDRIAALRHMVSAVGENPKQAALLQDLAARRGCRTLVFTAARATAIAIARSLHWRRVGVATAAGGLVASGPIPLSELLARFAPEAQDAAPVPPSMDLEVLVATDLVSEGLNLQDADAVIHYDLPWNPFRLAQRLGRIARLGSQHREVSVAWYRPPPLLDASLQLLRILDRKTALQIALPVPATTAVGRVDVVSGLLERRERLGRDGRRIVHGHAVVAGRGGCCVLRWEGARSPVWEVAALDCRPFGSTGHARLLRSRESDQPLPAGAVTRLRLLLKTRARLVAADPADPAIRPLARRILQRARRAGLRRERRALALLDRGLARLQAGLAVGGLRALADVLASPSRRALDDLAQWLTDYPPRCPGFRGPSVEILLSGTHPPTPYAPGSAEPAGRP